MRKGIHRGFKKAEEKGLRRAWVSEAPNQDGEWLTEDEYRAQGYCPDFDSLPILITQRVATVSISIDDLGDLPEVDKEYLRKSLKNDEGP